MRLQGRLIKATLLAFTLVLSSFAITYARTSQEFKFKIFNNTNQRMTKVLVAEPGQKKWSYFDIGKGIPAGATVELVWDKSTNSEECVQWFKAVWANGEESEAVKFDFCEEDLVLEFK
ncbi:MAG TPA: hypothetical protein VJS44_21070 [Pyrinomonadaceae bacterium]|nr:hypothetical protein [Pyrinomonadaceae bacterium]